MITNDHIGLEQPKLVKSLSSPRAKRAGPKGLRAESARAVTTLPNAIKNFHFVFEDFPQGACLTLQYLKNTCKYCKGWQIWHFCLQNMEKRYISLIATHLKLRRWSIKIDFTLWYDMSIVDDSPRVLWLSRRYMDSVKLSLDFQASRLFIKLCH